jgi:hypothetical protein
MYKEALNIYLSHAYKGEEIRDTKMSLLSNEQFFKDGIPSECRFGCYINPHMKLRVFRDTFLVDKNDMPDGAIVKEVCEEIRRAIESEWIASGLPVFGVNGQM